MLNNAKKEMNKKKKKWRTLLRQVSTHTHVLCVCMYAYPKRCGSGVFAPSIRSYNIQQLEASHSHSRKNNNCIKL